VTEKELRGLSPNFHIHVFVSDLYIPTIGLPILLQENMWIDPGNILKVPKREIFNRSDFPDFYTIKSLRVGDFGVIIKKNVKIFRGSFRGAKFLMRMLSLFFRRFFF
jgi:hypothetical protein